MLHLQQYYANISLLKMQAFKIRNLKSEKDYINTIINKFYEFECYTCFGTRK